jgi:hypothetical protein
MAGSWCKDSWSSPLVLLLYWGKNHNRQPISTSYCMTYVIFGHFLNLYQTCATPFLTKANITDTRPNKTVRPWRLLNVFKAKCRYRWQRVEVGLATELGQAPRHQLSQYFLHMSGSKVTLQSLHIGIQKVRDWVTSQLHATPLPDLFGTRTLKSSCSNSFSFRL